MLVHQLLHLHCVLVVIHGVASGLLEALAQVGQLLDRLLVLAAGLLADALVLKERLRLQGNCQAPGKLAEQRVEVVTRLLPGIHLCAVQPLQTRQ